MRDLGNDQQDEAKLAELQAAIDEGDASGIAADGVFERVREKLNLAGRTGDDMSR